MLEGLFGSLVGKILAAVTGLAGVVTGLAVTDAIPLEIPGLEGGDTTAEVSGSASTPVGGANASAGTNASTPEVAGGEAAEQAQEQALAIAGDALNIADEANSQAAAAKAAAEACIASIQAEVGKLTAKIPAITTPAAAQALVNEAGVIGAAAQKCVADSGALGRAAVDLATKALEQATSAAGILDGLGLPLGVGGGAVGNAVDASDAATGIAEDALKLAMSIAEKVTQIATGAVSQSLGIQEQVLEFALKSANAASQVAGDVAPLPSTGGLPIPGVGGGGLPIPGVGGGNPAQLGMDMAKTGLDFASSIMNQFLGGMGGFGMIPGFGG